MKEIIELCQGNPGALHFLQKLLMGSDEDLLAGSKIIPVIKEYGIKGTDLYILWSDLCDRDVKKVLMLCERCPKEILIDACSRQDYSGRKLVSSYLAE